MLAADRRPLLAATLAALAVWTRPVGVALVVPLVVGFVIALRSEPRPSRSAIVQWLVAIGLPVVAYVAWAISPQGQAFGVVQREYFGRDTFALDLSLEGWRYVVDGFADFAPDRQLYYVIEAAAIVLGVVASLWALRRWPGLALFGLAVLVIALTSGWPQSLVRYVLAVPAIFLLLAWLGKHPVFDRGWSLASTLVMGLFVTLFTFDLWVA